MVVEVVVNVMKPKMLWCFDETDLAEEAEMMKIVSKDLEKTFQGHRRGSIELGVLSLYSKVYYFQLHPLFYLQVMQMMTGKVKSAFFVVLNLMVLVASPSVDSH